MGERGRSAKHRCTKNVDPGGQGHVEGRVHASLRHLFQNTGEIELIDQTCRSLEMLVPWDVWQAVIRPANCALEENHRQSRIENLQVACIIVESFAELGHCLISMSHDVVVNLLCLQPFRRLQVDGSNAQTAVKVALVAPKGRQYHFSFGRSMLVHFQYRKYQLENLVDEVI